MNSFITRLAPPMRTVHHFAVGHKFIATGIALVVLGGGYWVYTKATSTEGQVLYTLGTASKATIISSVSASGQVSASNQLDITADVGGDLTYVGIKPGQKVGAGAVIARVDAGDAQRALRDAEANLESAQLALEKLKKPASGLTLTQAQNALAAAQESKTTADENLAKSYLNANGDIVSVFLDAPDMIVSLENILTGKSANQSQWNMDYYVNAMQLYSNNAQSYRDDSYQKFTAAKAAYNSAYANYQKLGTTPSSAQTEAIISQTKTMLDALAAAIKSTDAFIRLYKTTIEGQQGTVNAAATAAITTLGDLNTKTSTHVSAISTDASALTSGAQSVASAQRSIIEKQQSLADVQDGADALDIRTAELTVQQRENAVNDALATLADYSIRAPFGGTIATVAAKAGARIGSGGAVATIVTDRKIAELSLNEVDATKVAFGDKATLTFDAIEDLTLTGSVDEIDTVGTVTQGVVSYVVKISFDSQDARIKPGMTVNAAIMTDVKTDVLSVPSSAVKTQNGASYVLAFEPALDTADGAQGIASKVEPIRIPVETGITDDTTVEILSGLTEGQQVVVRSTTASAAASTAQTTNRTTSGPPGAAIRF